PRPPRPVGSPPVPFSAGPSSSARPALHRFLLGRGERCPGASSHGFTSPAPSSYRRCRGLGCRRRMPPSVPAFPGLARGRGPHDLHLQGPLAKLQVQPRFRPHFRRRADHAAVLGEGDGVASRQYAQRREGLQASPARAELLAKLGGEAHPGAAETFEEPRKLRLLFATDGGARTQEPLPKLEPAPALLLEPRPRAGLLEPPHPRLQLAPEAHRASRDRIDGSLPSP